MKTIFPIISTILLSLGILPISSIAFVSQSREYSQVLSQSYTAQGNRGLAKLALGDKQGAITDTSRAAKLFRQAGQMDLYQKAMSFLKKIQ